MEDIKTAKVNVEFKYNIIIDMTLQEKTAICNLLASRDVDFNGSNYGTMLDCVLYGN